MFSESGSMDRSMWNSEIPANSGIYTVISLCIIASVPDRGEPVPDRGEPVPDRGEPVPDRGAPVPDMGSTVPERGILVLQHCWGTVIDFLTIFPIEIPNITLDDTLLISTIQLFYQYIYPVI